MKKGYIPTNSLFRLLKSSGAKRVAISAAEEMKEILEEKGKEIALRAIQLAQHSGRNTVQGKDVRLAKDGWRFKISLWK